jgi:hypothetical protein
MNQPSEKRIQNKTTESMYFISTLPITLVEDTCTTSIKRVHPVSIPLVLSEEIRPHIDLVSSHVDNLQKIKMSGFVKNNIISQI